MDNLLFKRILISILVVALVAYVGFLFVNANFGNSIETEEIIKVSNPDVINADCYIVRDESYLYNNNSGVMSFNVNDGDNVSVGQKIADIYSNENDAVSIRRIKEIDKEIKNLQTLSNSNFKDSVGLDSVNNLINDSIIDLLDNTNKCDYTGSKKAVDNSLYYINERQIVTGQSKGFKAKISQLESEKQSLINSCSSSIGAIKTDKAGYYVSKADGYENTLKYKNVKNLTVKDLKKVKKKMVSSNVIGKIITNPVWYVVCQIDKDDAIKLSKMQGTDEKVTVTLPFISKDSIESRIYSINQDSKNSGAVLVLACDYMNPDIANIRHENVNISTLNYSGLKVSKRALHEDYVTKTVEKKNGETVEKRKKVQGVYVLYGSELVFKEISITYSTSQYVLCNPTPEEGVLFNGKTVQLYDQVVIKGDNLYDGKVVA